MSHPLLLIATPPTFPTEPTVALSRGNVRGQVYVDAKARSPWATVKVGTMATAGWYRRWGGTHESPLQILHVALTSFCDFSLSFSLSFFFLQIAILTDLPCAGCEGKVSSYS